MRVTASVEEHPPVIETAPPAIEAVQMCIVRVTASFEEVRVLAEGVTAGFVFDLFCFLSVS